MTKNLKIFIKNLIFFLGYENGILAFFTDMRMGYDIFRFFFLIFIKNLHSYEILVSKQLYTRNLSVFGI